MTKYILSKQNYVDALYELYQQNLTFFSNYETKSTETEHGANSKKPTNSEQPNTQKSSTPHSKQDDSSPETSNLKYYNTLTSSLKNILEIKPLLTKNYETGFLAKKDFSNIYKNVIKIQEKLMKILSSTVKE